MSKFNIAVVGATGNVGREILNIIDSIGLSNSPVSIFFLIMLSYDLF